MENDKREEIAREAQELIEKMAETCHGHSTAAVAVATAALLSVSALEMGYTLEQVIKQVIKATTAAYDEATKWTLGIEGRRDEGGSPL